MARCRPRWALCVIVLKPMHGPSATAVGDIEVLIAASRKEKVSDRQGLAEAAGLKPVIMDVESYASRMAAGRLLDGFPNKGVDALIALFEVGSQTTSLHPVASLPLQLNDF
mgnify:CR=1 FL=1